MTQDQLAEQAQLSRSFISLFESGKRGIDVRTLRRIAQALDLACRRSSPNREKRASRDRRQEEHCNDG